jgi:flagellar biosynthesis/type III secretory pathway protein FliH
MMDMSNLYTFIAGGMSVYMFFWQQGRAKKADEEAVQKLIHTENEKQNKATEENNSEQHKRHNNTQEDLKKIQYKDGYNDGYRDGVKDGKAEARAQVDMIKKVGE